MDPLPDVAEMERWLELPAAEKPAEKPVEQPAAEPAHYVWARRISTVCAVGSVGGTALVAVIGVAYAASAVVSLVEDMTRLGQALAHWWPALVAVALLRALLLLTHPGRSCPGLHCRGCHTQD